MKNCQNPKYFGAQVCIHSEIFLVMKDRSKHYIDTYHVRMCKYFKIIGHWTQTFQATTIEVSVQLLIP